MTKRRYKCVMDVGKARITVNVFTDGIPGKERLKVLAIKRGIDFMKEFGNEVDPKEVNLIGYINCGLFDNGQINFGNK